MRIRNIATDELLRMVALQGTVADFENGVPKARSEGTGILYMVELPTKHVEPPWRFRSMAIGPFERPFRQFAWSCELMIGECFECCPDVVAWEFEHDIAFASEIKTRVEALGALLPQDPMAVVVARIKDSVHLPLAIARGVIANVLEDPCGLPKESEEGVFAMLQELGLTFSDSVPELISPDLRDNIGGAWEASRESWETILGAGFRMRFTKPI